MPPEEISFRPSRAKQFVGLAILAVAFVVCSAGFLLLWSLDARDFQNIAVRALIHNLRGLFILLFGVFAVLSAVATPILLIIMLRNRPAFALTPDGIRIGASVLVPWEEIDEIHEFVDHTSPAPIQQVLIGLYFRDDEVTASHLGTTGRWQMNHNKRHNLPPVVLATHHLQKSTPELLDDIEAYLEELQESSDPDQSWPTIYRRKD